MTIQRDKIDDWASIYVSACCRTAVFRCTLAATGDFEEVQKLRQMLEAIFQHLDEEMQKLCGDDIGERTVWAGHVKLVCDKLRELDRNLAFKGTPKFN